MATIIKTGGGGYSVGYDDGHTDGYNQGYSAGHNAAQKILLANALVDIPSGWKLVNYPSGNGPVNAGTTKIPIVATVGGTWGTNTGGEIIKAVIYYSGGGKTVISINVNQACQGWFNSSPIVYVPQYFSTMEELLSVSRISLDTAYHIYLGAFWTLEKQ